tara:strand:+ start:503 stop:616 length:114 start_codon:yes stop_codon:yes gene_type:complete
MSELEYLFFQDQEEFQKLFSDSLIYDLETMEIFTNEN